MTPETEQNVNSYILGCNLTNKILLCILLLCFTWPILLIILFCGLSPLIALIEGDPKIAIHFLPFAFLIFVIWGYRKALRDTAEIARQRQQPPPKLSKWEEKKKAESLYKFP